MIAKAEEDWELHIPTYQKKHLQAVEGKTKIPPTKKASQKDGGWYMNAGVVCIHQRIQTRQMLHWV